MTGIAQSFILEGTRGITARVTVQEEYDSFANTSDLQIGVEVASATYGGHIYYISGTVSAQGQTLQSMSAYAGSHFVYLERTGVYYPIAAGDSKHTGSPWTLAGVSHEEDGSKTVTIDLRLTGEEENGSGADDWEVYETLQVALTQIPRASAIAATDAVVGAVSMVAVSRKSPHYTHTIGYRFGSITGYLTRAGISNQPEKLTETSLAFRIPDSFYSYLTAAKSGSCHLECITYAGDTQVGQAQSCAFTVSADPEVCGPQVRGAVTDQNPDTVALTGDAGTLVRYCSNALCVITATARAGASITHKEIDGIALTGDSHTWQGVEKPGFTFTARDSRGFSVTTQVTRPMVSYIPLTCRGQVSRTDPTSGAAALSVAGDCFSGSFGKVSNSLTLRCRVGGGAWQTMTPHFTDNRYEARLELTGLNYLLSYPVEVQATDRLQSVTQSLVLGKGVPVFDWGERDFAFHVPVTLAGLPTQSNEAASKAYADRKLSVVKLWENPDPSAEFPAQTVQADLSGCAFVLCAAVAKAGEGAYQLSSLVPNIQGSTGSIQSIHTANGDFWLNCRSFTLSYNGVRFHEAWMRDMAHGSVYEDWRGRSVPVAIYGIKGTVQEET